MTKLTYVEALNVALEVVTDEAVVEKLKALKASIEKRNAGERKPTKTQVANEALKADIVALLADGTARTITEIMAEVPSLEGAKAQKVSALVTQLKNANVLKREEVKRKAYFSLA